ncbi:MAG: sialidase family protein [Candidatus Competibacteraceae bacterium]
MMQLNSKCNRMIGFLIFFFMQQGSALAIENVITPLSEATEISLQPLVKIIRPSLTKIKSSSDRMISYRYQEHSWLTDDNALHAVINLGSNSQNTSLALYSSFDKGQNWSSKISINGTNDKSTSDGFLYENKLFLTHSSPDGHIVFSVLEYDRMVKNWRLTKSKIVYQNADFMATGPTLIQDAQGKFWVVFTRQNNIPGLYDISVYYSINNGDSWIDTRLIIGAVDSSSERSAKLVLLPDRIGVVYTNGDTINWSYRLNDWDPTTPWSGQLLFQYSGNDEDPFASHFSVATDQKMNIHVATRENKQLLYLRFDNQTQSWDSPRILTSDASVAYMQVSVSTDNRILILYNANTIVKVLQSTDYGGTFSLRSLLVHPSKSNFPSGADFSNPRVESPSLVGSWLPVLQQFVLSGYQSLLYYYIPLN